MVDLAPGTTVTVVQPSTTIQYAAPGIVQGLWLKEGPAGPPASDADVAGYINNSASLTKAALTTRIKAAQATQILDVRDFGTLGTANDSAVIQAALTAAGAINARVGIPWGASYIIDNVGVPEGAGIVGFSTGDWRFSSGAQPATFKHLAGSSNPMLVMNGAGNTLESVRLDGNGAPGTVLRVAHGFETLVRKVRVINGTGIGLSIEGAGNSMYQSVYVDNCATGVKIAANQFVTVNTLTAIDMHIERCTGTHLLIGDQASPYSPPEFLRFYGLHIEGTPDNGGVNNAASLINIQTGRSITFTDPFLYTGPGPALTVNYNPVTPTIYGVSVVGGTMLGKSGALVASRPNYLVDLVSGDEFSMVGTRLDDCIQAGVRIGSAFGPRAVIDPSVIFTPRTGGSVDDQRTTRGSFDISSHAAVRGHVVSTKMFGDDPVIAKFGGGTPTPSATSTSTDTKGTIFFGSNASPAAGPQVQVTFAEPYATDPTIVFTPANAATAALGLYVAPIAGGTGFYIYTLNAPAASQASGTYQVAYHVLG